MKQQTKQGVLIDFATITNPVVLLDTILLHKKTYENIFVTKDTLFCEYKFYDTNNKPGSPDLYIDLLEPYAIDEFREAQSSYDKNYLPLDMKETNLSLALEIFQFAVSEKIIQIINDDFAKEGLNFLNTNDLKPFPSPHYQYDNFAIVSANIPFATYMNDVGTVVSNNLFYSSYMTVTIRKVGFRKSQE